MKLTTVATYNQPLQAQMARNALEVEGIWAVLADAEVVWMDLVLANAVGGVKVQVKEEDAQRATEALIEIYGSAGGTMTVEVDETELARQAMESTPDDSEEPPPAAQSTEPLAIVKGYQDTREQYARRFFQAVLFAFFMPPLFFYAIYLLQNVAFGNGPLTKSGWFQLVLGIVLFLPLLYILLLMMGLFGFSTLAYPVN